LFIFVRYWQQPLNRIIIPHVTRLFEQAVATVAALPEEQQDDIARILLQLAGVEQPPYVLSPDGGP
jgi:hypothetical protein